VIVRASKNTALDEIALRVVASLRDNEFGRRIRHCGLMITTLSRRWYALF